MKELAILLRAMQLYTQNAHNLVEKSLRAKIQQINPSVSIGTQQLIGGIADDSEKRSYKIKQRIKGGK